MLAGIVILLYSGMFMGILPEQEGISWESHLLGSLVGIFVAYLFKSELEDDEVKNQAGTISDDQYSEKKPFLSADIFDKTKLQRALEKEEEVRRQQESSDFFPPFWNQDKTW